MPAFNLPHDQKIEIAPLDEGIERITLLDKYFNKIQSMEIYSSEIAPGVIRRHFPSLNTLTDADLDEAIHLARSRGKFLLNALPLHALLRNDDREYFEDLLANCKDETEREKVIAWSNKVYENSYTLSEVKAALKRGWGKIRPEN